MTPKSIITVKSTDAAEADATALAFSMAQTFDAHLDVIALSVSPMPLITAASDGSGIALRTTLEDATRSAEALSGEISGTLDTRARTNVFPVAAIGGTEARTLARLLRFNDLAVLPRPYGPKGSDGLVGAVECALFHAELPVLIAPPDLQNWQPPKRIVLAWNEGREALAAARAAMPLLKTADTCFIVTIDPPKHGPDRSDPGGLLAQYLARQGVRCEIDVMAGATSRVGDTLERHVMDRDADMLVMGAYGRSRWSEAMFGGATRQMLQHCQVPLFMAH